MSPVGARLIGVVRSAPVFSALEAGELERLVGRWPVVQRPAGAQLFGPDQPAERFYLILRGRVKVFKLSRRGDEQILHLYGPGETFGEAAVLSGMDYPAFAETVEDCALLAVGRAELRRAIAASPELALGMMAGLSAKLREFGELIEELSLKEVPARLAGLLLGMARRAGGGTFRLGRSKRDLAARLGAAPETLSRALARLKAAGLIRLRGAAVTILDARRLEELAEDG